MSRWLIASEEPKGTVNQSDYSKTQTDNIDTVTVLEKDIFPKEIKMVNPGFIKQDTNPTENTNKDITSPAYTNNDSLTNL